MEENNGFTVMKVTNPLWIGQELVFHIQKFLEQLDMPTVDYETLYSFFVQLVQYGGDQGEFWVVLDDSNSPVAFATWMVKPLPARGTVGCDYMYSWNRMHKPVDMLLDEFAKFGKRHNCPIYTANVISEPLYRVFRKAAASKGFKLDKKEYSYVIGRKN